MVTGTGGGYFTGDQRTSHSRGWTGHSGGGEGMTANIYRGVPPLDTSVMSLLFTKSEFWPNSWAKFILQGSSPLSNKFSAPFLSGYTKAERACTVEGRPLMRILHTLHNGSPTAPSFLCQCGMINLD